MDAGYLGTPIDCIMGVPGGGGSRGSEGLGVEGGGLREGSKGLGQHPDDRMASSIGHLGKGTDRK